MGDEVEFLVLAYEDTIQEDYSLTTFSQAEKNISSVKEVYYSSNAFEKKERVRLKNGLLSPHVNCKEDVSTIKLGYEKEVKYKLVSKTKSGEEMTKQDCLIAMAYGAEHDDVEEVKELVAASAAPPDILSTRMPFALLGTILHVCADFGSLKTLAALTELYADKCNVKILDRDGETALHNVPNYYSDSPQFYADSKKAARHILDLAGVNANELLAVQNGCGQMTALCKALVYHGKKTVCAALLDAAKEKLESEITAAKREESEKEHPITTTGESVPQHWLSLATDDSPQLYDDDDDFSFWTALHIAVCKGYDEIVSKILAYPGAKDLNLTNLPDDERNTPLHVAAAMPHRRHRAAVICSMLLEDGADVRSQNRSGETPLHIASAHRRARAEVCQKLLEYGTAPLSMRDKSGRYPLTNAFDRGDTEVVKILLDAYLPSTRSSAQAAAGTEDLKSKGSLNINERLELGLTPLHVAVATSSQQHIAKLIRAGASVDSKSDDGRTPLHLAAQKHDTDSLRKLLDQVDKKKDSINMRNISGQTALHMILVRQLPRQSTCKDQGESITDEKIADHGESNKIKYLVTQLLSKGAWVNVQDCNGETPLHQAARTSHDLLRTLLDNAKIENNFQRGQINDRDEWISMCNFSGETALHEAARAGHQASVGYLLCQSKNPGNLLTVRDMENKTALDWAAVNGHEEVIKEMMSTEHNIERMTRNFLRWNLKQHINHSDYSHYCKDYIIRVEEDQTSSKGQKEDQITSLLRAAIADRNEEIARELINRGADVTTLDQGAHRWLAQNLGKKASDQPTLEDTLGRRELVQGVANLLLNPYTQTPLTIGVFGSWGTGKSSFMLQVEQAMLHMAVKETFKKGRYSLSPDKDLESSMINFSMSGCFLRYQVEHALKKRMIKANECNQNAHGETPFTKLIKALISSIGNIHIEKQDEEADIIDSFPMELQSNYHQLFKYLALTDRSKLVQSHEAWYKRKAHMYNQTLQETNLLAYTPAVLTLHYNAWRYDNKNEASAGLAVEICHQLESFMTPHQWLRMCWRYSWESRPGDIVVHLILPISFAIVTIFVILIFWKFVPIATKLKAFSLPLGIVGVMWAFFKASLQVIQPVTQTMLNFKKSIDEHHSMLGYQHQVIADIKFLKDQLCDDAHFGWKVLGFLCQFFISNSCFMKGTWIWKQHPCLNNFRIVVFIDDLDRCDEKTVLELLRVTNLILPTCGIDVVIGVDKDILQRVIIREFLKDTGDKFMDIWMDNKVDPKEGDPEVLKNADSKTKIEEKEGGPQVLKNVDSKTKLKEKDLQKMEGSKRISKDDKYSYTCELADSYLQKIIQLPIQMPEPSKTHIKQFIQDQVGQLSSRTKSQLSNGIKRGETMASRKKAQEDEKKEIEEDAIKENQGQNLGDSQSNKKYEEDDKGKQVKDEGDPRSQDDTEDGASEPIVFRLLLANYSPMEKDMLKHLCQLKTNKTRIPREWKRFLNYHRLAWTILLQDCDMKRNDFKGWQRKLILWIFICWNWRVEMNLIFKNWDESISKIISKQKKKVHLQEKVENGGNLIELCDIMKEMESNTKEESNQKRENQEVEVMNTKSWSDLYKTLEDEYDIPIHFIAKFQQFRFYCVLDPLEIDEHSKPKK